MADQVESNLKRKLFGGGQERSDPCIDRAVVTVADFQLPVRWALLSSRP